MACSSKRKRREQQQRQRQPRSDCIAVDADAASAGPAAHSSRRASARKMSAFKLAAILALLLAAAQQQRPAAADEAPADAGGEAGGDEGPSERCAALLRDFADFNRREAAPYGGGNLVYFLHIPRTAGRTFHTCLLKQGTPPARRCPKSYDHLRIDVEVPDCGLLSSHDDFSVVQRLPPGAAVVTQLRDPVERFLSAYEFAVEVAARQLRQPRRRRGAQGGRVLTDEVWPWSKLVPFFLADMRPRMAAADARYEAAKAEGGPGRWVRLKDPEGRPYYWNRLANQSKWELDGDGADEALLLPPLDPYDNELVMPLREFVSHPVAAELLHDGEALQVLGLTNYSHWAPAAALRACARGEPAVSRALGAVARRRLRTFSHVGTTEALGESVESAAASLGMDLAKKGFKGGAGDSRRANVENPNRALRHADAMAAGDRDRGEPAWRRLAREAAAEAAAGKQQQQQQQEESSAAATAAAAHPDDFYDDGGPDAESGGDDSAINNADADAEQQREREEAEATSVHALAGDVRRAKAAVDALVAEWNDAVGSSGEGSDSGDQPQQQQQGALRALQARLATARAELAAAQDLLLGARDDEADRRARELAEARADAAEEDGGGGANDAAAAGGDEKGDDDKDGAPPPPRPAAAGRRTALPLGDEFHVCAANAQSRNAERRRTSLSRLAVPSDGRQVAFSSEARRRIPPEVIEEIRRRNPLDAELYSLAKDLLRHKRGVLREAGLLRPLGPVTDALRATAEERKAAVGPLKPDERQQQQQQQQLPPEQHQRRQQQQREKDEAGNFRSPAGRAADEREL